MTLVDGDITQVRERADLEIPCVKATRYNKALFYPGFALRNIARVCQEGAGFQNHHLRPLIATLLRKVYGGANIPLHRIEIVTVAMCLTQHPEIGRDNSAKPVLSAEFNAFIVMAVCGNHVGACVLSITQPAKGLCFEIRGLGISGMPQGSRVFS
jgi:hypothetical protein